MSLTPTSPPTQISSSSSSILGRGSSPRPPPSYICSSLDRSPSLNPLVSDERPRVPPPIYLRSSSPQPISGKGTLKIHVPAWGIALVRPPRPLELHPLDPGSQELEPPTEDTVLSGALEVIMKERRRVQAISVGVQSVCRLHMGLDRLWEEDGVFERGVEILGGYEEGIWLEKGSQSFGFSILLPATLATSDRHSFGRIGYILTARVKGIAHTTSLSSMFKAISNPPSGLDPEIPFVGDFERVIARSDHFVTGQGGRRSRSASVNGRSRNASRDDLLRLQDVDLNGEEDGGCAITIGEGSPSVRGLYTRRQSSDHFPSPQISPLSLSPDETPHSANSLSAGGETKTEKTEKTGWMKGDLCSSRELLVHAIPPSTGGVGLLDIRKEGFVEGIGSWKFTASGDVFCISSVILLSVTIPSPSPLATIFIVRLVLSQSYTLLSPRTPNGPYHQPEAPKHHVLYQVGRVYKAGGKHPGPDVESLWRGSATGGQGGKDGLEGWKVKAVARIPNHEKIRPTTNDGTITPIRVSHELILQVYYSLHNQFVSGEKLEGPGELRLMSVKMPVCVPSCYCVSDALNLPTYETSQPSLSPSDMNHILSSPPNPKKWCMCGSTFAELGEKAMKKMQAAERDDLEERMRRCADLEGSKGLENNDGLRVEEDGSV
ncbi:uncharacterized protein L203_105469 [Cryptococcus depauperatus CBS 7841]|uniref:Uncharacterized protein n=1 Tax=Cryptococcus depauperatus CBS 7841 TaxID=1295531 RepID=A0A1E3IDA8_9TREE|nr:hypothetical protein L203_04147 [Cryptococcus depauperatus CBS 7841]